MHCSTLVPLLLAAACSAPRAGEPTPALAPPPVPLPDARHGHRIEAVAGGLLAFGGFGDRDAADDRGARAVFWLPDGAVAWTRASDMPLARAFFGSAATADAVFAIADGVDRYDLRARTWSTVIAPGSALGPARLPRSHFATATLGERAFVLGGYPIENSDMLAIDLRELTVTRVEPPPGFQPGDHFHFLAALGGELHVAGGLDERTFTPRREHHVRRDGRWVTLPPPPDGMWAKFGGSAVVGDRWHVFGDFGHHVFDAATGTWSPRAPLPFLIVMPAAVVRGGSIWIVGGGRVGGAPVELLEYRIAEDRWVEQGASAAPPRAPR